MNVCNTPGCPTLTNKPHCPQHQPPPGWTTNPTHRNQHLPPGWNKLRATIIQRDQHQCIQCGSPGPLEVDHIDNPHNHHPDNLRTLCKPCHATRTSRQANQTRWTKPPPHHQ